MEKHGLKRRSNDYDDNDIPDDDSPRAKVKTRRFLVVHAQRHEKAPMERLVYEHARMRGVHTSHGWFTVWCNGEVLARFREHLVRSWRHLPSAT